MSFEIIKQNYERGLWTKAMLRVCVKKGLITEKQYEDIVDKKETNSAQ
jgi:hypothetical protein